MMHFTLLLLVALLDGADRLAAQETVEVRGITSVIKLEEVVYGHRPELNGKFKMRATELDVCPGRLPWSASSRRPRRSICACRRGHIH